MKPAVAQIDSLQRPLCYQHRMRLFASIAAVALCIAGCGEPPGPSSSAGSAVPSSPSVQVKPANIAKVRGDLPAGYEVSDITGRAAPAALWGFGHRWTADPPQCGALADPVVDGAVTRGWSASGGGGIVNAVVTGSPPDPIGLDPALIADCGQWRLSGGHTSGSVTFIAAPAIDGRGDGGTVHRDHDRRRGRHRNSFPRRHVHRLPGRLRRIHHRGHRPRITESSTRTGFRGGIAGENGVGVTGLSRGVRVHWRRCSPRERCSASRAPACWPHVASRPRRISRTPTSPTSRI